MHYATLTCDSSECLACSCKENIHLIETYFFGRLQFMYKSVDNSPLLHDLYDAGNSPLLHDLYDAV